LEIFAEGSSSYQEPGSMDLDQAKALIPKSADDAKWIKRACTNDFATINDKDYSDPVVLQAL
jgi:hypothetical protein